MKAIFTNSRGVALVETMIAVLLFGIALIGILDLSAQSILMGKRSNLSYTAYNLAKNRLETLKTLSFGDIASADETDTLLDENGVPDDEGTFKRNTTVTTSYGGDARLTSVTVTVDYQVKGSFVNRPASLSTAVFEYA